MTFINLKLLAGIESPDTFMRAKAARNRLVGSLPRR
jgi:hypothetical protein